MNDTNAITVPKFKIGSLVRWDPPPEWGDEVNTIGLIVGKVNTQRNRWIVLWTHDGSLRRAGEHETNLKIIF